MTSAELPKTRPSKLNMFLSTKNFPTSGAHTLKINIIEDSVASSPSNQTKFSPSHHLAPIKNKNITLQTGLLGYQKPNKKQSSFKNTMNQSRSSILLTDKISLASYMIIHPQDDGAASVNSDRKPAFLPFRTLINQGGGRMTEKKSKELFEPFKSTRGLQKQLDFNKEQETLFRQTAQSQFHSTKTNLGNMIKSKEIMERKMPRVRVHSHFNPVQQKLIFEDELATKIFVDDEGLEEKYNKFLRPKKPILNTNYQFHWAEITEFQKSSWKPNVREAATFVIIGQYGYLYGGRSKDLNNDITALDLNKWSWFKPDISKEIPPYGRCGHSAGVYKKTMVIFGGVKSYNTTLNIRECLNDVRFFSTETNEWTYIKCHGDLVEPRRHHIGLVVGKHLLVHGGLSSTGEYLDDCKALNLQTQKWETCKEVDKETVGIAFHKACLVISEHRKEINLFKMSEPKNEEVSPRIKMEGVYFFGGRYCDDSLNSILRILKIGQSQLQWVTPKTLGKPPTPRYLHTIVHNKMLNIVIIYGGRNEELYSRGLSPILGDFHTLQLDTLTWVAVDVFGEMGKPRCSHISASIGSSLLIFGGINFNVYCPSDINVIEMDPVAVSKLTKTHERRTSITLEAHKYTTSDEFLSPSKRNGENENRPMISFLPMPHQMNKKDMFNSLKWPKPSTSRLTSQRESFLNSRIDDN